MDETPRLQGSDAGEGATQKEDDIFAADPKVGAGHVSGCLSRLMCAQLQRGNRRASLKQ